METTNLTPGYRKALKNGTCEFAQLDHPRTSGQRKALFLRLLDEARISYPARITGEKIEELMDEGAKYGLSIPFKTYDECTRSEIRSLKKEIINSGIAFVIDPKQAMSIPYDKRTPEQQRMIENYLQSQTDKLRK